MAKGYFLYHLDKTTCGGRILSGAHDDTYTIGGVVRQRVREGDPVTCGKQKGRFRVCGGMGDTYSVEGPPKQWAGSIESFSSCPCRARFIPSVLTDTYDYNCNRGLAAEREQAAKRKRAACQAEGGVQASSASPDTGAGKPVPVPVFAKSCLRGAGCTDAGTEEEPQENFAVMSVYQSQPAPPASDAGTVQHGQAAKKTPAAGKSGPTVPERKRSLFDKVTGFFFGEAEAMPVPVSPPPLPPSPVTGGSAAEAGMAASGGGATARLNQNAARALEYRMKRLSGPEVWESRFELNLPFVVMGAVLHSMLKGEKDDLLTADRLLEVARNNGTVPTRVRYNWVEDPETGRLKAVGYHTSAESGCDHVRVRLMEKRFDGKYRFWGDGPGGKVRITWTPADAPGSSPGGWDTGNEELQAGTVTIPGLEHPDTGGVTVTPLPAPEEKDFRDYILVFPGNVHPPIYIYLSKPPVEFLEVAPYRDFNGRSRQGFYEVDHMPSRQAVVLYLEREHPDLTEKEIKLMADQVAAMVIPKEIHRKDSMTYGGRNHSQKEPDSRGLREAADRNFDAVETALMERRGMTEAELEAKRAEMHNINTELGLYK